MHWQGRLGRRDDRPTPDLYAPSTPDYRERTRETSVKLANGLTLVSMGEPVTRLAGECQPVTADLPPDTDEGPSDTVDRLLAELQQVVLPRPSLTPERDWRADYGVAKLP